MKRILTILLTAAFVVSLLPTRSTSAKEIWRSVRSKNFYLIGNAGDREIRQVATKLEQFREGFAKLFPRTQINTGVPITVIVFKNSAAFSPYMPVYNGKTTRIAGYFQSGEEQNYILLTSDMSGEHPYGTIYHEFVHSLANDNSVRPLPVWLNEGVAEVYSTFEVSGGDKRAVLGAPVVHHLQTLRENRFIPLQRLFSVVNNSPEYNESDKQSIFYAESWALVHYLVMGNGHKRQPQMTKFIELMDGGMSMDDSFREAFQTDYDTLQKELMTYVTRPSYPVLEIRFDEKLDFDKEMVSAQISEAEGEFHLGNMLASQRRADAEAHLLKAISLDPGMPEPQAVMGRLLMMQGKTDEAKPYLERAFAANSKSYLAYYNYALALSKEGDETRRLSRRFSAETLTRMKQALSKAIELNPGYVASYQLLGYVNLVVNEDIDESISLLAKMSDASPGRQNLNFILGQLYLRKLNLAMARQLIEPIANTAKDPESRANAQRIMNQIEELTEDARNRAKDALDTQDKGAQSRTENASNARPGLKRKESTDSIPKDCGDFQGDHIKGLLFRIDCKQNSITLYLRTEDQLVIKFQTDSLDRIVPISCGGFHAMSLECGTYETMQPVTIYYRKSLDKGFGIIGEPFGMLMWDYK